MQKFIKEESNKEYHADKSYISSSGLRMYLKSPAHYKHYELHGEDTNKAFVMGSLYHTALLEPEKLGDDYELAINRPEIDKGMTSKMNKEWKVWCEGQGRSVIDEETWKTIEAMKTRLRENEQIGKLIDKGMNERSYYIEDYKGVRVKVRPDKVTKHAIIDFKTTDNASTEGFTRTIFKYGYHIQAAMYLDVLKEFEGNNRQFVFVVQEKKEPYAYQLFRLSKEVIDYGRQECERLLEIHKECVEKNEWKGYEYFNEISEQGVQEIVLPSWIT